MSYIYVAIQVLFIILIGATGPIIPRNIAILNGIAIGVFTMFWALWTMRLSNLNMLLIDLHFKFFYEEKLLLKKYPEYIDYKKKTKRIIPFIY